jgi:hypothetical protein
VIVEGIALMLSVIGHDFKRDEPQAFGWDQLRQGTDPDQVGSPGPGIVRCGIDAWIEIV